MLSRLDFSKERQSCVPALPDLLSLSMPKEKPENEVEKPRNLRAAGEDRPNLGIVG